MANYSAVTGIRFPKLNGDNGATINDPSATPPQAGDIRIGIFQFAAGNGAVAYAPPPNGGSGAGNINRELDTDDIAGAYFLHGGLFTDSFESP